MHLYWAPWGPAHWKWFRRWALLRMGHPDLAAAVGTMQRPVRSWAGWQACVLCGGEVPRQGQGGPAQVLHALATCAELEDLRLEVAEVAGERVPLRVEPSWLLDGRCHPDELKVKVRYVGRALGRVALALGSAPPDHGVGREPDEPDESQGSEAAEEVDDV